MDGASLWTLIEQNRERLIAYGVRLGATRVQAENCLQDRSCAIWERQLSGHTSATDEEPEHAALAFLYTCMRNCVISACAQSRARDRREHHVGAAQRLWDSATPSRPLREEERREAIEKAKGQLSPMQRCVAEMRYEDGLTYREVAAELKIQKSTVQNHLERATEKLRNLLNDA